MLDEVTAVNPKELAVDVTVSVLSVLLVCVGDVDCMLSAVLEKEAAVLTAARVDVLLVEFTAVAPARVVLLIALVERVLREVTVCVLAVLLDVALLEDIVVVNVKIVLLAV